MKEQEQVCGPGVNISKECTCTAPPPQPCGPYCNYPYTDCCGTTAACCRGGESEKWIGEQEHGRGASDLERQLADERARIDCATRGGWLSDDLECAGEDGPACWTHLLREARGKLDAVWALRFDHNHNTRVFLSHCPRCQLDRILKEE